LAQLDLHYGKESKQVIADTCQYKAVLNVTDVESQEYFSKAVGTYDKIRVIRSQQYDRFTHFKAGSSVTTMAEDKPIIRPHEFATLEQIVLLTPFGAFRAYKRPYYMNIEKGNSLKEDIKKILENERGRKWGEKTTRS
jgi:type IV secretion system protein VirD4